MLAINCPEDGQEHLWGEHNLPSGDPDPLEGQRMLVGGGAEEKIPVALHAVRAIGVGQLQLPLIELIFGAIRL